MTTRKRSGKKHVPKKQVAMPLLTSLLNNMPKKTESTGTVTGDLHNATQSPMYRELEAAKRHELKQTIDVRKWWYIVGFLTTAIVIGAALGSYYYYYHGA